MSHGVENYFPGLWVTGISDAFFLRSGILFIQIHGIPDTPLIVGMHLVMKQDIFQQMCVLQ